ncbi:MAG: hypothetical protein ABIS18_11570 [Actinomycetota bacterium]
MAEQLTAGTLPAGALRSSKQDWIRQYPPLAALVIALLITVLVLPNALNLPQSNPSTVLEYAPVPPDDSTPPPDVGSVSALGLGTSSTLSNPQGLTIKPTGPEKPKDTGRGLTPKEKRCVGKPLRQTEDPNSPPCVPYFDGDNGGETWQGVTGEEVRVLIYHQTYMRGSGETTPAQNSYCDIDASVPNETVGCVDGNTGIKDVYPVRVARAYSKYFNDRFQTYRRKVRFFVFFSGADSASKRSSDAADNWQRLKPFAVIDKASFGGFNDVYAKAMAKRQVSVYGQFAGLRNQFYRDLAPMVWSFFPDIEHAADLYTSYICTKVAPFPVTHAGDDKNSEKMNGLPRKYALMYTTDPKYTGYTYLADLVRQGLKNCPNGAKVDIVTEIQFNRSTYSTDRSPESANEARLNVAKLKQNKVTTVLWAGGYEAQHTPAAALGQYYPEWILSGDQQNDTLNHARNQDEDVWSHAWAVSNLLNESKLADSPCRQAFREASPGSTELFEEGDACNFYRSFFTLFKAIQVAGPELNPTTIDQGHHAIPRQASTSPFVAACFYDPGDYTCVKDAQEIWWDKDAPDPEGDEDVKGCWRMVNNGSRYLAGTWDNQYSVFANPNDICNTVSAQGYIYTP